MIGKARWRPESIVYSCLGKTRWASEKAARFALAHLKRANPGAFDSTVRPYRCGNCKKWHLGHGR